MTGPQIGTGSNGEPISFTWQIRDQYGNIVPKDLTGFTVSVKIAPVGSTTSTSYPATVTSATQGQFTLTTVTQMFTKGQLYNLQAVATNGSGAVHPCPDIVQIQAIQSF